MNTYIYIYIYIYIMISTYRHSHTYRLSQILRHTDKNKNIVYKYIYMT